MNDLLNKLATISIRTKSSQMIETKNFPDMIMPAVWTMSTKATLIPGTRFQPLPVSKPF
jgi:hypothetical protein